MEANVHAPGMHWVGGQLPVGPRAGVNIVAKKRIQLHLQSCDINVQSACLP